MIDDPNFFGYRAPVPGERVFHWRWNRHAVIAEDQTDAVCFDEVEVIFDDDNTTGIVKLKSLDRVRPDLHGVDPQCETVVGAFRCVLTAGHVGQECESYNSREEAVMLGVFPE